MLVATTSTKTTVYTTECAILSKRRVELLTHPSINSTTCCQTNGFPLREQTGRFPSLDVRASYRTSGPDRSTGSLIP